MTKREALLIHACLMAQLCGCVHDLAKEHELGADTRFLLGWAHGTISCCQTLGIFDFEAAQKWSRILDCARGRDPSALAPH